MFDYVKNEYNPSPNMVEEEKKTSGNLYIEYMKAPYLKLPKTLEDLRKLHKKKFWYNLRRSEKLFNENIGDLKFKIVKNKEELEYFMEKVFFLFNDRWKDEYVSFPWKCKEHFDVYKKAILDLSSKNRAFLAVLYYKETLLSFAYCIKQNGKVYFYQHATSREEKYKKYSLGKLLIWKLLEYLIEQEKDVDEIDFMLGEQKYKLEWAKNTRKIYIEIKGKNAFSYLKYYLIKVKIYLQFNETTRRILKNIFKFMERIYGKC